MARHESLLPREHGAYAEIAFPLLTGLTLGRPSLAATSIAIAATAFFLMHEPVAVLVGVRGARGKELWGDRARGRVIWLAIVGVVAGTAAVVLAPSAARLALLMPLGVGAVLLPAFLSGRLKTLAAEVLVIAALSATILPMAVSSGVEWSRAWVAVLVWFVAFLIGTLAVHAIKAKTGKSVGTKWAIAATPLLSALTGAFGLFTAFTGRLPLTVSLAITLAGIVGVVSSITPIHPRQLKRVGWMFVVWNTITWALLIIG
ncbi:MAG: YwiC-like family protein [Gemmatimonadota bacterium]|nr:MAG: YwiC-like family protein [Gemmatimonadota bacterium]